jgi:hypothetical protein
MKARFVIAALAAVALTATAFVACKGYGEGERCSTLNGNEGCEGLRCTPLTELGLTGPSGDGRCCPFDRASATTSECRVAPTPLGADSGIPSGSGNQDSGADDGSVTGNDGSVDTDAATDANGGDAADAGDAAPVSALDGATDGSAG